MSRQPQGKPRDRRKGRRPPLPPPVVSRPRVSSTSAADAAAAADAVSKPRVKGQPAMDFSYVGTELRRIAFFIVGMVALLIVLSFIVR